MARDNVILTDTRREVLSGEYDGQDNVQRTHESRIRNRSKTALDELIEVAESKEIDNARVFDPKKIRHLLTAIVRPGGLTTEEYEHVSAAYRNALYVELDQFLKHDWGEENR